MLASLTEYTKFVYQFIQPECLSQLYTTNLCYQHDRMRCCFLHKATTNFSKLNSRSASFMIGGCISHDWNLDIENHFPPLHLNSRSLAIAMTTEFSIFFSYENKEWTRCYGSHSQTPEPMFTYRSIVLLHCRNAFFPIFLPYCARNRGKQQFPDFSQSINGNFI